MKKLNQLEKKILGIIKQKRFRIYTFLFLCFILNIIPFIPYASVIINLKTSLLTSTLVFLFFFKPPQILIFLYSLTLFLISAVFLLLNQFDRAEEMGNYIFSIHVVQVIVFIITPYDKKSKK